LFQPFWSSKEFFIHKVESKRFIAKNTKRSFNHDLESGENMRNQRKYSYYIFDLENQHHPLLEASHSRRQPSQTFTAISFLHSALRA